MQQVGNQCRNVIYEMVGRGIVSTLNKQYGLSLKTNFVQVNTSTGYFDALKNAVDEGVCDAVVSDTTVTAERQSQVNFQSCPYGATSYAYLRTTLNNDTIIVNSQSDLNQTGVIIAFYEGTVFEEWCKKVGLQLQQW